MITFGYVESHPDEFKVCRFCGNIYKKTFKGECDCNSHDFSDDYKDVLAEVEEQRKFWVYDEQEISNECFDCMTIVTCEED